MISHSFAFIVLSLDLHRRTDKLETVKSAAGVMIHDSLFFPFTAFQLQLQGIFWKIKYENIGAHIFPSQPRSFI